jgi:hypothetical protein
VSACALPRLREKWVEGEPADVCHIPRRSKDYRLPAWLKGAEKKMKNRIVPTLVWLLVVCAAIGTHFDRAVQSNPIPFPIIMMPEEYINATISLGELLIVRAEVDGLYPFHNIGYNNVTMYYPVPPNSSDITVMMNGTSLEWKYSNKSYSTVIGEFPMIEWLIDPAPDSFEIRTHYSHPLPKDGTYSFLYAMGTGRYLESYTRETTAYVSINVSKDLAVTNRSMKLHALRYDDETGKWLWKPVNYTITQRDNAWLISLTKASAPFQPLVEDLLVKINPGGSVSYANGALESTTHVDKTTIVIGEIIDITLTLRNRGNDTLKMFFSSSRTFDILLLGGDAMARWSAGKFFALIVWELQFHPNQTFSQTLQWDFFLYDGNLGKFIPPPPGMYTIFGFCVGSCEGLPGVRIRDMLESGLRIELVPPDINHDQIVNIIDIAAAARAFGSKLGGDGWNDDADVQEDGTINIIDISIVAKSYGTTY